MSFNHLCIYLSTWFLVPSWTMAFRKFNLVSTFPIVRTNTNLSKKTKFTCFYSVLSFSIRTSVSSRCVCCRCLDNNNNNTTMIFFGFVLFDNTTQHKKSMEYTQDEYESLWMVRIFTLVWQTNSVPWHRQTRNWP